MTTISSMVPAEIALRKLGTAEDAARIRQIEFQRRVADAELNLRDQPGGLLDYMREAGTADDTLLELLCVIFDHDMDKLGRLRGIVHGELMRAAQKEAEKESAFEKAQEEIER